MFEAPRQLRSAVVGTGDVAVGFAPFPEFDFQKMASAVWRGKATILLTTAAALLLAILVILVVPHEYTAMTQILIDPTDLRAVSNELAPTSQMSDAALLQVESQVRVLTSDNVLRRVVKSEGLDKDSEFARGESPLRAALDGLLKPVGFGNTVVSTDKTLAALNELKRRVKVKRADRTYVVDVSVTSADPEKAARIANAVAQAYLIEQTQVRSDAARQVSQSLTARLNELKNRVREAEDKVEEYKARNGIVGANGQLVNEQQLSDLNNQLGAARVRVAQAKARLDQIEAVQRAKDEIGAFPEALQSQTITALRSQYAEVTRREAEQMTTLGSRHPAVMEIEAQAERLRQTIVDEVKRIAASARTEYASAKASEEMIARNVDVLKQKTMTTNESLVPLRELERDVQASRAIYESFLVRARETGEQERLDTKNIQVISKADLPQRRSSPPSSLLVAFAALLVGAAAGTGFVLLRTPPNRMTPQPSSVGITDKKRRGRALGFRSAPRVAKTPAAIPVLAVLPGVDVSFGLDAAGDPTSQFAMGIRKVYDAIKVSHTHRGNPSILVVASDDEDDSAAVALTLAAVAATTQRVLLIDADLERRTLSAIDADQSEAGLVDVAVGRRVLSDVVVRDRSTNINLLPFVSPNSRRDRNIRDEDIKIAFAQTKYFDMVIVTAMDLSRDPSARFFAGLVDHIVLVARADEADEIAVTQFVSTLGLDARKVRGAVLTGAEAA
jgi:uncharacterized protein involved in exopolysaccharide biosynthesis/Mrp family chromosome partitioning ATPase